MFSVFKIVFYRKDLNKKIKNGSVLTVSAYGNEQQALVLFKKINDKLLFNYLVLEKKKLYLYANMANFIS